MKNNDGLTRRKFLTFSGAMLLGASFARGKDAEELLTATKPSEEPNSDVENFTFTVGAPCLQAPGETTIGVSWSVSGLAKGEVEYADNPELRGARIAKAGGLGLVPINDSTLQVRITGLKRTTTYWYRTITVPFTSYNNIYEAKQGESIVSDIHSFTTMGADARAHFCVINDTHANWRSFQMVVEKVKELSPMVVIWNGDATNTTQQKETAVNIFLKPQIKDVDWSADLPVMFECGNHDFRGSWISKLDEVVLPREPSERHGDQWDLKWNFALRLGEMALIGLDTGEDKPDAHPKWFGLANFEPYRRAQAKWLEEQFARPEIASAPFKVVFCHIPLFASVDSMDYPHDGVNIDPEDYAYWSRECSELWGPILNKAGVQLVVSGHRHRFRYDPPEGERKWAQVIGGGPELGIHRGKPDAEKFPTVIEGFIEKERLRIVVHDVFNKRVVLDEFVGQATVRPLKVLTIGNSFSRPVAFNLPKLAREAGVKLDIASLYIGGCSLERHVKNYRSGKKTYEVIWDYASDGEPRFVKNLDKDVKPSKGVNKGRGSVNDLLVGDDWDIVTIQQASPLSWKPETYEPWADELIAAIHTHAPQAKIMVQQTWSYNAADARISPGGQWGFDQTGMYERIRDAYAAFAAKRNLELIKVGDAVQAARKDGWEPVGRKKDTIHLNRKGELLQARVWLNALFGK